MTLPLCTFEPETVVAVCWEYKADSCSVLYRP